MGIPAILAALDFRDRTGRGQYIDLSMQDITAWLSQAAWGEAAHPPVSLVVCRDGYIVAEIGAGEAGRVGARGADGGARSDAGTRRWRGWRAAVWQRRRWRWCR